MLALERLAAARPTPLVSAAGALAALCLFSFVLLPNLQRGRSEGPGAACRNNMRVIGQALQDYGAAHQGRYPETLSGLEPTYLRHLPGCPDHPEQAYRYELGTDGASYTLSCGEGGHGQVHGP